MSSESVHVPNLGERASSLLSQLRSEIASMKTARLSNASPIQDVDSAGDGTEMSQQSDTQERDSSPLSQLKRIASRCSKTWTAHVRLSLSMTFCLTRLIVRKHQKLITYMIELLIYEVTFHAFRLRSHI